MTDTITNLLKDLNIASDLMADTDTFPTGQAIMKDAAKTIAALQAENAKLREGVTAKEAIRRLKLIRDQDQGCGGRLNPQEIYQAMKREANNSISALSGQDAEGET